MMMSAKAKQAERNKNNNVSSHALPWTDYLRCSICGKEFNRKERQPVSLGCGHTVCRICLLEPSLTMCKFDQTLIAGERSSLPINSALFQLLPLENSKSSSDTLCNLSLQSTRKSAHFLRIFEPTMKIMDELAIFLKPGKNMELSRPMQRKLIALVNNQLMAEEGRRRAVRCCKALAERTTTELILLHQSPTTLSASLWDAVRARGCQFLGPAMQEEALKLIQFALEDESELSRKVLVQLVVKNLQPQFPQASKTSIGHVVQLLYRASCFIVTKRDGDSSLMRLKDEFLNYDELRKEHDAQIVQIAREAGLRIAPDQWSALLYGDQVHKSYMQSIIDRLQSGTSFHGSIKDLNVVLERSGDPGNIRSLLPDLTFLAEIHAENTPENIETVAKCVVYTKKVVTELFNVMKHHQHWLWQAKEATQQTSKYKTSMCRDCITKGVCPRGDSCTFAHSEDELQHYRNKRKKRVQNVVPGKDGSGLAEANDDGADYDNEDDDSELSDVAANVTMPKSAGDPMVQGQQCHFMPIDCNNPVSPYSNNLVYGDHSSVDPRHHCISGDSTNSNPYENGCTRDGYFVQTQHYRKDMSQFPAPCQNIKHPVQYVGPPVFTKQMMAPGHVPQECESQYHHAQAFSNQIGSQMNATSHAQQAQQAQPTFASQHHPFVAHNLHSKNCCHASSNQQLHGVARADHPSAQYTIQPHPYHAAYMHHFPPTHPPPPQIAMVTQRTEMYLHQTPAAMTAPSSGQMLASNVAYLQVVPRQPSDMPSAQNTHNQHHLPDIVVSANAEITKFESAPAGPQSVQDQSLDELRRRKNEVINKLVQKRIVQEKPNVKSMIPRKECFPPQPRGAVKFNIPNAGMVRHVRSTGGSPRVTQIITASGVSSDHIDANVSSSVQRLSNGQYCLWTGTSCIPSLSGLSFQDPLEILEHGSPRVIDVTAEIDTRTAHVAADTSYKCDGYVKVMKSTNVASYLTTSMGSTSGVPNDDDIVPIQDMRIVSKYGPIARTVRSKTTSAIPEQVQANGNGMTHPIASDVRWQSNFSNEGNYDGEPKMSTEVEQPSGDRSYGVSSEVELGYPYSYTGSLPASHVQSSGNRFGSNLSLDFSETDDEGEDLMLAMELQQIEIGIQNKLKAKKIC